MKNENCEKVFLTRKVEQPSMTKNTTVWVPSSKNWIISKKCLFVYYYITTDFRQKAEKINKRKFVLLTIKKQNWSRRPPPNRRKKAVIFVVEWKKGFVNLSPVFSFLKNNGENFIEKKPHNFFVAYYRNERKPVRHWIRNDSFMFIIRKRACL